MLAGAWWMLVGTHSHCVVKVLGERISDRLVQDTPGYCPAERRTEVKVASLLPVTVVRVFTVGGPSSNSATCVVL